MSENLQAIPEINYAHRAKAIKGIGKEALSGHVDESVGGGELEQSPKMEDEDIERLVNETGFEEKYVAAALDLFNSPEAPLDLMPNQMEDLLVKLSNMENGAQILEELYNSSNDYNISLVNEVVSRANGIHPDHNPMIKLHDFWDERRAGATTNGIYHPSVLINRLLSRVHMDSENLYTVVDYKGLDGDELNENDERLRDLLEKIEKWGSVHQLIVFQKELADMRSGYKDEHSHYADVVPGKTLKRDVSSGYYLWNNILRLQEAVDKLPIQRWGSKPERTAA